MRTPCPAEEAATLRRSRAHPVGPPVHRREADRTVAAAASALLGVVVLASRRRGVVGLLRRWPSPATSLGRTEPLPRPEEASSQALRPVRSSRDLLSRTCSPGGNRGGRRRPGPTPCRRPARRCRSARLETFTPRPSISRILRAEHAPRPLCGACWTTLVRSTHKPTVERDACKATLMCIAAAEGNWRHRLHRKAECLPRR